MLSEEKKCKNWCPPPSLGIFNLRLLSGRDANVLLKNNNNKGYMLPTILFFLLFFVTWKLGQNYQKLPIFSLYEHRKWRQNNPKMFLLLFLLCRNSLFEALNDKLFWPESKKFWLPELEREVYTNDIKNLVTSCGGHSNNTWHLHFSEPPLPLHFIFE